MIIAATPNVQNKVTIQSEIFHQIFTQCRHLTIDQVHYMFNREKPHGITHIKRSVSFYGVNYELFFETPELSTIFTLRYI